MNTVPRRRFGGLCQLGFPVLLVLMMVGLRADEPPAKLDSAQVKTLIDQLGSRVFDEREAALKALRAAGADVRPQLLAARKHASPEVRSRVATLIRELDARPLVEKFEDFAGKPDAQLDLEEGMWLIARILNPDVERADLTRKLDDLAAAVRKKLDAEKSQDPKRVVAILREVLFQAEKFGGNFDDYSNPDNSSLEKVLQTRKGLPILLSHVTIAVARRVDLPIVGVPTGGKYIVKYDGQQAPAGFPRDDIFFDPFNNGQLLDRQDREKEFPGLDPDHLPGPQSVRMDLIRMLANIETHLFNRDETDRGFQAVAFRTALLAHLKRADATP